MLAFPPLILNRISVSFSFLDISEAGDGGYMVNPIVRFDPRLREVGGASSTPHIDAAIHVD